MTYWALLLAIFSVPVFADGVLLEHTMPPVQLLHADGTPVEGVAKSTSVGEAMEKAGMLPCEKGVICKYKASWDITLEYKGVDEPVIEPPDPCENPEADGCPCPDSDAVYPNCPVVPDPNEPVDPPIDPDPVEAVAVDDDFGQDWQGENVKDNDILPTFGGSKLLDGLTYAIVTLKDNGAFTISNIDTSYCGEDFFLYAMKSPTGEFTNTATVAVYLCAVPPDPNAPTDPVAPPIDPNEPTATYPEPEWTYVPMLPTLGQYSEPGVCETPYSDATPSITLKDGERLNDAVERLAAATNGAGGMIEVPWNVDTVQCDKIKSTKAQVVYLSGIPGPQGQLPRFYCRTEKAGGTIPNNAGLGGDFIADTGSGNYFLVENIHVDGYHKWLQASDTKLTVVRNNQFNSANNDGIGNNGIQYFDRPGRGGELQVCGNEISHAGQGNARHCFYVHGSTNGVDDFDLKVIDNKIHSCNWSSGVKSIANHNLVSGNEFWKYKDIPGLPRRYTQQIVDIPGARDFTIRNNTFHHNRDEDSAKNAIIGVPGRRALLGSDIPEPGWILYRIKLADGTTHDCRRDPTIPECQLPDSEFWNPDYWNGLNKEKVFKRYITDNTFIASGFSPETAELYWVTGTFPAYTKSLGGWSCLLDTPNEWFERLMVYIDGNTYIGFDKDYKRLVRLEVPGPEAGREDACGRLPAIPDLRSTDTVTFGPNEVWQ